MGNCQSSGGDKVIESNSNNIIVDYNDNINNNNNNKNKKNVEKSKTNTKTTTNGKLNGSSHSNSKSKVNGNGKDKDNKQNEKMEMAVKSSSSSTTKTTPTSSLTDNDNNNNNNNNNKTNRGSTSTDTTTKSSSSSSSSTSSTPKRPNLQTAKKVQSGTSLGRELRSSIAEEASDKVLAELRPYHSIPLTKSDIVLVMQGWNKALAFKTAFSEALLFYWRVICSASDYNNDDADYNDKNGIVRNISDSSLNGGANGDGSGNTAATSKIANNYHITRVENNKDPLFKCFGDRLGDAEQLLMGVLDGAIRSTCPHAQEVQREAYRPMVDESILKRHKNDFTLECETMQDHFDLFARLGIAPKYWALFIQAVRWTMKTHAPYAQTDDLDDLELPSLQSAWGRVVALHVAIPAIETKKALATLYKAPVVSHLQTIWGRLTASDQADFGETFYRNLLSKHPELLDFFSRTDMDSLAIHLSMALDLVIKNVHSLGVNHGSFRTSLDHLGEVHRRMNIPTYSYALVGGTILDTFQPIFDQEEADTKDSNDPVSSKDLRSALTKVYGEIMSIVYYPMLRQEKLLDAARSFYEQLKEEFKWSDAKFEKRMTQIEEEIASTKQYTQTTEELQMGARIAWRNSAKCIGRISWNTLKIRDCRHIDSPKEIFKETRKHLLEATAGTNIQSIMTVFKPQSLSEPFGVRFWSSQLVRYAAYKNPITGTIIGDPANLHLTEYLLDNKLWTPPKNITPFDVLPLVLKLPGEEKPYVHQLPSDCVFEVPLEHPTNPKLSALGYRWTTVPAISNFKMNLGGIIYQNMPFNGWFVSTEIVRNLMERYDAGPKIAEVLGINMETNPMWRQAATIELENMVIHSFQKNGYTIVDPMSVGQSFCTHVRREREQNGRECPGQWSWIGGLVGPTNPTWHLEMRDFLVNPQYEYCAEGLALHVALNDGNSRDDANSVATETTAAMSEFSSAIQIPKVLITYGSETGNAESAARTLARELRLTKPLLMTLNKAKGLSSLIKKRNLTHIISVCSTFGKGNAPANADEFFRTEIEPVPASSGIQFAVLALGSSIYPDFCQAGVKLDNLLHEAGLERCVQLTKADEAAGSQATIAGWIDTITRLILPPSLFDYLTELSLDSHTKPPVHSIQWKKGNEDNTAANGVSSETSSSSNEGSLCIENKELLQGVGDKSIRKITFEAPSDYETGDHLSVVPVNSSQLVRRFLKCFEVELESMQDEKMLPPPEEDFLDWISTRVFDIQVTEGENVMTAEPVFDTPTTLKCALTNKVDLSLREKDVPNLCLLLKRFLVEETMEALPESNKMELLQDPQVLKLLDIAQYTQGSKTHTSDADNFIATYPTIVDFFETFKEVLLENFFGETPVLHLAEVLMVLGRLQPRYYSISSSNKTSPKEISLTVGVLTTKTSKGVTIEGVCSHYLSRLKPGIDRAVVKVHTSSFRLPNDPSAPILMVGAGTGLSPMMGFLEEKLLEQKQNGGTPPCEIHLFFGCRTEADFIYKDFLRRLEKDGLIKLHLALSRSPKSPKKYVQDLILESGGKHLSDLLANNENTHYYVCGDARMADSCYESCVTLLRRHEKKSRVSAALFLKKMRMQGRWQSDVWGILSHFEDAKKDIMKSKREAAKLWMTHFRAED